MQQRSVTLSPEVRAYAERQREQEFDAVNLEAKQKWWHKLGAKTLDIARDVERVGVSYEIVTADEVVDRSMIEALAWQLIENYEATPKALRENEAEDNARTALFEALTASGHMSVVELEGDQREVHQQVVQRLLNSYFRPNIPAEEQARNFEELCEELVVQTVFEQIEQGYLPKDTKINTLSEYAHSLGSNAQKWGYRPSESDDRTGKGMARETSFAVDEHGAYKRVIKQISRANTYAPATSEKLQKAGLNLPLRSGEADVQLLGSQLLSVRYGALEVVQLLDRMQRGMKVMYGEAADKEMTPYERLEEVSRLREAAVESHVDELAEFERSLDKLFEEGSITATERDKRYIYAVREHVRAICVRFPSYTRDAFGQDVVKDYEEAHRQFASGDVSGAAATVSGASSRESAITICGSSTENPNQDPNDPNKNGQSLEEILERLLMRDWKKRVEHCPICGNENVMAEKKGEIITDLDYGCTLNVCTNKSKIGDGALAVREAEHIVETAWRETNKTEGQASGTDTYNKMFVEALFGEGAVAKERVELGGTRTDILSRNKQVIARGVELGRLALAKNR
jgi:hypothetical protein